MADILRRQEVREPTSGAGGVGTPSTADPATQSQSGKGVLESVGITASPRLGGGLAGDETAHRERGRSSPHQDL